MASQARQAFDSNCRDIDRLLEIHGDIGGGAAGRRLRLEVLNKSAIVLVTAIWEAYCEDVAAEGLQHLTTSSEGPEQLPSHLRKLVAKELKAENHELAVWKLADDGWREVLQTRLEGLREERNRRLNTPKSDQIDDLFEKALGITTLSTSWRWKGMSVSQARSKLDGYVSLRGEIAHRGAAAEKVTRSHVEDYYAHVKRLVGKTGGRVNRTLKVLTGTGLW